jgi:hypothetical protein
MAPAFVLGFNNESLNINDSDYPIQEAKQYLNERLAEEGLNTDGTNLSKEQYDDCVKTLDDIVDSLQD